MFEFQIPHRHLPNDDLPDEVKALFRDPEAEITAVSVAPWGEHCTECAIPQCYTTCDLYEARSDARCRRFAEGIGRVADAPNHQNGVVRIAFKRWAQLMAKGTTSVVPVRRAGWLERLLVVLDRVIECVPDRRWTVLGRTNPVSRLYTRLKHELVQRRIFADAAGKPDYFLVEIWNPEREPVKLSLLVRSPARARGYQNLLKAEPGFGRWKIPYAEIAPHVDVTGPVSMHLIPGASDDPKVRVLYFGTLGFVRDARWSRAEQSVPSAPVKVVAWDLDNTVWDGILLEDGADGVKLRSGVARVIAELDRRGIVSSVVSKNDPNEALAQLRRFGLAEYFVFPRIGWAPKSVALAAMVSDFGVSPDSVVLVDDSPFEREQVRNADPRIRVFDASEAESLPGRAEFDPIVTSDAARRRELYQVQETRVRAEERFSGDQLGFLRSCGIRLTLHTGVACYADRLHELVQRTNQLNFSGSRHTRAELDALLADPRYEAFALDCEDRFGEYGLIGFALVERAIPRLVDFALSCRVQAKRVEHAFLAYLLARERACGGAVFEALYRPTERNAAAGAVFSDLGFEEVARDGALARLRFDLKRPIPDDRIVDLRIEP